MGGIRRPINGTFQIFRFPAGAIPPKNLSIINLNLLNLTMLYEIHRVLILKIPKLNVSVVVNLITFLLVIVLRPCM